jgi:riboflavin synthase
MFTGIIETIGKVVEISENGACTDYVISSAISNELKIDQSVSHNGACLTVVALGENWHKVTAIPETLIKTNMGEWNIGTKINLERCTKVGDRLDGHIVSGHVDQTATCIKIDTVENSWTFTFRYQPSENALIVEKGSITINGISLTVFDVIDDKFSVGIIPYTFEYTNLHELKLGQKVNIEFDMIGKYVVKMMAVRGKS